MRNIKENIPENSIILAYQGIFNQDSIMGLGEVLAKEMTLLVNKQFAGLVFSIFIEMAQNVMHYSFMRSLSGSGIGSICIYYEQKGYNLETINPIVPSAQSALLQRINEINKLSPDDLKRKCLQIRRFDKGLSGGGAGLGLIEIARRSANPLQAVFQNKNENSLDFILKVTLKH
ncbi:MAG TPA: SiaB family protein kinase [Bacteroidales bacterium]|nr:SiaB family protein kinase [Bacteroidales bacterium]